MKKPKPRPYINKEALERGLERNKRPPLNAWKTTRQKQASMRRERMARRIKRPTPTPRILFPHQLLGMTASQRKKILGRRGGGLFFFMFTCLSFLSLFKGGAPLMVPMPNQPTQQTINTPAPTQAPLDGIAPIDSGSPVNSTPAWSYKFTDFEETMNRWHVWETVVKPRNPNIPWLVFKTEVFNHNPHLNPDHPVFYPDQTYLLPLSAVEPIPTEPAEQTKRH